MEGIAYYVGLSTYSKTDKIVFSEIHETKRSRKTAWLKIMIEKDWVLSVKEYINLAPKDMGKKIISKNAQAWSLFHFLRHGEGGKYREGFHKYLAEISAGRKGDADAFEKFVGSLSEIEPAYAKYIRTLKPTTNTR